MRLAITGTTGRLGAVLADALSRRHEIIPLPRAVCDLTDSGSIARALDGLDCEVLLNPAGMTDVDACEADPRTALQVNSAGPGKLASWAAGRGVRMVHFSTDYVFDGRLPGKRGEGEPAAPLHAYGRAKLAGERAVLTHPGHLVMRVSWLYGQAHPSFVERVLDLALAGEPLAAVADKWSMPTRMEDLATWVEVLLEPGTGGVLHACHGGDPASWHDVACVIADELQACGALASRPRVAKQALGEQLHWKATRPRHTAMCNRRLASLVDAEPRDWETALRDYVRGRVPGAAC